MTWTEEQIIALSPDASSTKSGKDLGKPGKWVSAGISETALWGECQGSGSKPYRTQIDLRDTAFKCSCPSRKFPCKHGLGLLFLCAAQNDVIKPAEEPDWVKEWIEKRGEKAQKKSEPKPEEAEANPAADTKAQTKRAEARTKKVESGLAEIKLWLKDLIRNGLLALPEKKPAFWQGMAARMVDAQAPGLASMVRNLGEINFFGEDWQSEALQQLARIYLLIEGYRQLDRLSPALQSDIRLLIGWTQNQDELKASPGMADEWLVLGRQTETEQDITIQRNWLYGANMQQFALIINFAHRTQAIDTTLAPGTAIEAELVYFPSSTPLRALIKERRKTNAIFPVAGLSDWQAVEERYAQRLAINPWIDRTPLLMDGITPFLLNNHWLLKDQHGQYGLIDPQFTQQWKLMAYSGGHPLSMFLIREKDRFLPLGIWHNQQYILL